MSWPCAVTFYGPKGGQYELADSNSYRNGNALRHSAASGRRLVYLGGHAPLRVALGACGLLEPLCDGEMTRESSAQHPVVAMALKTVAKRLQPYAPTGRARLYGRTAKNQILQGFVAIGDLR